MVGSGQLGTFFLQFFLLRLKLSPCPACKLVSPERGAKREAAMGGVAGEANIGQVANLEGDY